MSLFRVTMTGCGLLLLMENAAPTDAAFIKNEFVLAESEDEASRRAIEQVRAQLQRQADAGGLMLKGVDIQVDVVVRTLKFWKLRQHEGFVFFPRENVGMEDQVL